MRELYLKEFEKLNSYQREAVTSLERYALLNAVVGSGKTTVLAHKVLYLNLVKGVPLDRMVVLTFTNKAAKEIKDRILSFGDELKEGLKYFGTFHSVARTILSESPMLEFLGYDDNFSVIDNEEAGDILTDLIEDNKLKIKYRAKLLKRIEEFKKGKHLYGVMKKDDDIGELVKLYNEEKLKQNLMDFDDLIDNCIRVLEEPLGVDWVIVDEFQDTDIRQLELIKKIAGKSTSIFAIGDPNQIIYSWRTGTTNIFQEFKKNFNPREISLPLNYRSSSTIIGAARAFLGGGELKGTKEGGSPIIIKRHHDSFNEALHLSRKIRELNESGVELKDIGVLYRRQAQSEVIAEVFEKEGVPFRIVYKKSLPGLEEDEASKGVNLLTLHASKGLEFSHVFITGLNMGNMPLTIKRGEEEEEARLFFVGITRARNYLELSYLTKPSIQGMTPYPSPYISMLPPSTILKEDEGAQTNLKELMTALREEKEKKLKESQTKKARHPKYGEGIVIYEDDNIIRVDFEGYGEKEFSKLFCPLEM